MKLEFCYKGDRQYVHGTDIFNAIIETQTATLPLEQLSVSFHKMATNQLLLVDKAKKAALVEAQNLSVAAQITFKSGTEKSQKLYLLETSIPITCRYPYDEQRIVNQATILEDTTIQLDAPYEFTLIENIVALNKAMLKKRFKDAAGKWVFSKLKLKAYPIDQEINTIRLRFRKNLGFKLTDTEIFINQDTDKIGNVNFSLI